MPKRHPTGYASPISAQELVNMVGTPQAPAIIDVCLDEDFAALPRLIPTALRWDFSKIDQCAQSLQSRTAVIVCQKGLKLSQGAAALLACHGISAHYLTGGISGWHDQGLPTTPPVTARLWVSGLPATPQTSLQSWVLRRFFAPEAKILAVPADQTKAVAERFGAEGLPAAQDLGHPPLAQTLARAPALLEDLWPGLTDDTAITLLDALYASRIAAQ